MLLAAATATAEGDPRLGKLILAGAIVLALIAYVIACWLFPFRACWTCKGKGRKHSPTGRRFGNCWLCKGSGRRLRRGRLIYDLIRTTKDNAT